MSRTNRVASAPEVRETVAFLTLALPPINALDENALQDLMKTLDEVENGNSISSAPGYAQLFFKKLKEVTGNSLFWDPNAPLPDSLRGAGYGE